MPTLQAHLVANFSGDEKFNRKIGHFSSHAGAAPFYDDNSFEKTSNVQKVEVGQKLLFLQALYNSSTGVNGCRLEFFDDRSSVNFPNVVELEAGCSALLALPSGHYNIKGEALALTKEFSSVTSAVRGYAFSSSLSLVEFPSANTISLIDKNALRHLPQYLPKDILKGVMASAGSVMGETCTRQNGILNEEMERVTKSISDRVYCRHLMMANIMAF